MLDEGKYGWRWDRCSTENIGKEEFFVIYGTIDGEPARICLSDMQIFAICGPGTEEARSEMIRRVAYRYGRDLPSSVPYQDSRRATPPTAGLGG